MVIYSLWSQKISLIKNGFVHNNRTGGCGDRDECTGGFWDVTLCNGENPTCEEASVATGNSVTEKRELTKVKVNIPVFNATIQLDLGTVAAMKAGLL